MQGRRQESKDERRKRHMREAARGAKAGSGPTPGKQGAPPPAAAPQLPLGGQRQAAPQAAPVAAAATLPGPGTVPAQQPARLPGPAARNVTGTGQAKDGHWQAFEHHESPVPEPQQAEGYSGARLPPYDAPTYEQPQATIADVTVLLYSDGSNPQGILNQLDALGRQSVQAAEIWIHADGLEGHPEDLLVRFANKTVRTPMRMGRAFRVTMARQAPTQFVAILDQDTIPGGRWLERSISALLNAGLSPDNPLGSAVVASSGVQLINDGPSGARLVGPEFPSDQSVLVDFGRQGWVFTTLLARALDGAPRWAEEGPLAFGMGLAAAAQRQGLPTAVLDYSTDREDWAAINTPPLREEPQAMVDAYALFRQSGWDPQLLGQREAAPTGQLPGQGAQPHPQAQQAPPQARQQVAPQAAPQQPAGRPVSSPGAEDLISSGELASPGAESGIAQAQIHPDAEVKTMGSGDGAMVQTERILSKHEETPNPHREAVLTGGSAQPGEGDGRGIKEEVLKPAEPGALVGNPADANTVSQ